MKNISSKAHPFFFFFLFNLSVALAQQPYLDSLRRELDLCKKDDTTRVLKLFSLADYYGFLQFDSCLFYAAQTSKLSQKLDYPYGKFLGYMSTFHGLNSQGNYSLALETTLNIQKTAEELKYARPLVMFDLHYFLGLLNREMSNYEESKTEFQKSIDWQKKNDQPIAEAFASYSQLGILYANIKQLDSALIYAQKGYELAMHSQVFKIYFPLAIGAIGNINVALGKFAEARRYFWEAINQSRLNNNVYFEVKNYNNLAVLFDKMNIKDSSIYYARISLSLSREHNFAEFALDASKLLSKSYDLMGKSDSAFAYMKIMLAERDSVFSQSKVQQFQQYTFNEIRRQQEVSTAKERYQYQVKIYAMLGTLGVFLLLGFILYRNNKQKQKANKVLETTLANLKSAQSQLIQSEKMASLGELTAGIAHEIQNPLNFVNNFSEINNELVDELQQELKAGKIDDAIAISNDIKENELKINHHGKRADAIVKGMLQHSRSSTGVKKTIDINALADEYLRLAYHGLRAKDKDFNATMKTDFDETIGEINIVPQDIGRVLLNLYNNAFYAVSERRKLLAASYEPLVSVSTKKSANHITISVKDNGNGIPQKVVDKIFQPFFTTKPTGQGTGLGLSLSYDIIKAHSGEIKVETKESEGTTFIIQLPTN